MSSIMSGQFDMRHHKSMDFNRFMQKVRNNMTSHGQPLFTTRGVDLWEVYLNAFEPEHRQEHNCRCCKKFIEEFGGLAYLSGNGTIHSFLWDDDFNYGEFSDIVRALEAAVVSSKIDTVFVTDGNTLGTKHSGGWDHFSIKSPESTVSTSRLKTPFQLMAAKKEDFRMLSNALNKYSRPLATQALSLLQSENLNRGHLAVGIAEWFHKLQEAITNKKKAKRDNLIWSAVATAPAGFCNISSSVLGSLLDDLAEGYSFETVKKRWNNKTAGTQYRRPQNAPGAQNIKRSEEIFDKLGLKPSTERRYARLEDLELLWSPRTKNVAPAASPGVFQDVVARDMRKVPKLVRSTAPATIMTFEKFKRKVLPTAEEIFIDAPGKGNYSALLTAVHPSAPLLFQWSNPVNWYVYSGGSTASSWNPYTGKETKVTGITLQPNMWDDECENRGEGVHFILDGAKDSRAAGLALFPETLRSELHECRKTIESFSNGKSASGRSLGTASGIKFNGNGSLTVKVVSNGIMTKYKLDRMD